MKEISRNYNFYLKIFLMILLFTVLSACNGITPTSPTINSFTASPPGIASGDSSTLSWSVTDADTLSINQGIGTVTGTSITVSPTTTTTYTLTATNAAGSVTQSVIVTVGAALGSIDIQSNPAGATVYLDGVDTGSITPIVLTGVSAGTHTVKLELYHYQTKTDINITVNKGETTYLNWALDYASTETLTLQPGSEGKDADVDENNPTVNSGNYAALWVGYGSFARWRAYLQFDLNPNPLPAGAVVTNAYLRLYQYGGTGSFSVGVYEVTSNWAENSITWNNQPTSSSTAEDAYTIYSSSGTWRTWYIDDLVKGWLDGNNYGVLIKPTDESSNDKIAFFSSSDSSMSTQCPKLEIMYYIP